MAHKVGLNRKDQILCAKWLTEGIDPKLVAKKLKTSESVVMKFTQEKLDAADEKARARAKKLNMVMQKQRQKAAILSDAIDVSKKEFE